MPEQEEVGAGIRELLQRMGVFEKMFQVMRIVDPVRKKVIHYQAGRLTETEQVCHDIWKRGTICENCISLRAFQQDEVFVKMESSGQRIFMVTAIPILLDDRRLVMELLRDVTDTLVVEDSRGEGVTPQGLVGRANANAVRDALTGVYNRAFINERLSVDALAAGLQQQPLSVIMADLDHLKAVNDNYGHIAGDLVLQEFARLLRESVRKEGDWVARFGGEEFLICMPGASAETAHQVAERARIALELFELHRGEDTFHVTASFGIYTAHDHSLNDQALIDQADKQLYRAKRNGRNRVQAEEGERQ